MGNIGASELLLIFLVALLVFGAKRLPEIARGLGQGIREFRSATREITRELQFDDTAHAMPPRRQPPPATAPYTPPAVSHEAKDLTPPPPAENAPLATSPAPSASAGDAA